MEKKDLERFKNLLLEERREILDNIMRDDETLSELNSGGEGDLADQAYTRNEKNLVLDISRSEQETLKKIEDALKRIDNGTYGICEIFGTPIEIERLEVIPYTTLCVKAAKIKSKKGR